MGSAWKRDHAVLARLEKFAPEMTDADANTLRRCELTLQRWAEKECGDGSNWAIARDEQTGKPFNVYHGPGKSHRYAIPDREAGALRRARAVAESYGLAIYHQTDCRGCMLYVGPKEMMTDQEYLRGAACCGDRETDMKATITVRMDNDAFADTPASELARILREAADQAEDGETEFALRDITGNAVGKFAVSGR